VRRGGIVLVANALGHGDVANPVRRDAASTAYRTVLEEIGTSPAVLSTLSPAGGGLLQLVRL
jgi:predicted O-methyltransferase YrrM